ncbi:MAG: ABC transporter permease [Bacteroidetes bacterium]|nr:ABC transporter permease [Bacteroidota bacterium]
MFRNYIKIAFRNLRKNKLYTILNIAGLGTGMAVALLIGLWVYDEISFNGYHHSLDRIAMIQKNRYYNGAINTEESNCIPLAAKLRENYSAYFDQVVTSSYGGERVLQHGEKSIIKRGLFMEPGGQEILDLQIVKGSVQFPLDPSSLLLSENVSRSLFGQEDPIDKIIRLDNRINLKVAGVYKNIPRNSNFRSVAFYGSFETFSQMEEWVRESRTSWGENSFPIYVKMAPQADMAEVSARIKNAVFEETKDESRPEIFLHPLSKWHFYPEFKNGVAIGVGIQTLWIFGLTGIFVLLLAAINFMNLSTARSESRAREIGVRKSIGSLRSQLIGQFYTETFVIVLFAAVLAALLAELVLPVFNKIAEKDLAFQWSNPVFWIPMLAFLLITGLLAGSYPAFYLSSFRPVHILKGKFRSGRREVFSRKALVVFQFSISVALIISTVVIARQVQFAKERPIGYDTSGLIQIQKRSPALRGHFHAMRQDLHDSGAVVDMAESTGPVTEFWLNSSGFQWKGKPADLKEDFITLRVTPEFGSTIGWKMLEGRDFSRAFPADTSNMILNEAAVKLMGLQHPINEMIRFEDKNYLVVGVAKNFIMDSPYEPVKPTVFMMRPANMTFMNIRLNPEMSAAQSIAKVEDVLKRYDPSGNFNIKFVDHEFGQKFWREDRIARLTTVFSLMAVLISLLGIFGLAAFMAEQRTKEIGVRKVLGAGISSIWGLISSDFVLLIVIAFAIGAPVAYVFMQEWLLNYEYRTELSWQIFAGAGLGALLVTLLTVSFQAVRAAAVNPVKSLKTE